MRTCPINPTPLKIAKTSLRYFAAQAYRARIMRGVEGIQTFKVYNGPVIAITREGDQMRITWMGPNGERVEYIKIAKAWLS